MLERVLATLFVAAGLTVVAVPAQAVGPVTFCYAGTVVVNGEPVLDQSGCQPQE